MAKRYFPIKLLLLICSAACIFPSAFSQDTTICYMRDPEGRIREHNVDFLKMTLDVKFNAREGKVIGDVKYDFKPIQFIVDTLFLDAPGIDIQKVLLDGKEVQYTTDSAGLTIRFLQAMSWNKQYKLEIKYESTPRKGIYFIGWNVDAKNTDHDIYFTRKQIWTQGQGVDNRYWIPCYDDVDDKLLTETIITFDSSYTVVSNGTLKDKKLNKDGTYTWHYAMNHPMEIYLVMIAIDKYAYRDYHSRNGITSRQYYYSDRPGVAKPTYEYSDSVMDFIQNETGTHYPWLSYANIPVQDFMYGAMENTTATVYGDFLMNDKTMIFERPYIAVNAHELTHQWFGDDITEYSGSSHWLHESFATYYSKQFMRHIQGEEMYEWGKRGEANAAINADKTDRYPVASSRGGGSRHYPKGSFVIDMLRYVVGDSVFKRSIAHYLKEHAYSNVTTYDFMMSFMETAGVNLDWFFDQWVYRSGFPVYHVSYQRQNDRVAFFVNQTQKTDNLMGYYRMPLVFEVHFKDASSSSKKVWLSGPADTVYVSAPKNEDIDYTLFDPASNVLKSVEFTKSFAELTAQAEKAKHVIDRYDAIIALRDIAFDQKRDFLIQRFGKETLTYMKTEIISQLAKDRTPASIELMKKALHDEDFLVRRSVIDNLDSLSTALFPEAEKLLRDTSLITIEITLRKLYRLDPSRAKFYLGEVRDVKGVNDGVRIAWLEISSKEMGNREHTYEKQLVEYTSNRYEFRTRGKAMDALNRLNYCDNDLIQNLFNAALYTNTRLSGPATNVLKTLLKTPANLEMAKSDLAAGKWKDWQFKILNKIVNPS